MPSIVSGDTGLFLDTGESVLANRIPDSANATETVNTGGSRYSITIVEAIVASDSMLAGGQEPNLGDSANATDTVTFARTNHIADSAAATEIITATAKVTISVSDSANATESVDGRLALSVAESANATETVTPIRTAVVLDSAAATDTPTTTRKVVASILDSAGAAESLGTPVAQSPSDSANATETVTLSTRTTLVITDSAAATESVGARRTVSVADAAVVTDTPSGTLKAVQLILDTAEAEDTIRLPASSIPNLCTNTTTGAASTWSGLPLNSLVEQDGRVFGAGPDGLYELVADGADDAGTPIAAQVLWDLDTFGSRRRKRLPHVYVSAACVGPFTVKVINEQGRFSYLTRLPGTGKARNHRAQCGQGLEAAYYRVGLAWTKRDSGIDHVIVEYEDTVRSM